MGTTTIKRLLYRKTKNGKHYEICIFKFENPLTKTRYVAYNLTSQKLTVQIDYETYAFTHTRQYKHPIPLQPNGGGSAVVPYGHHGVEVFCFLEGDHKDPRHVTHNAAFVQFADRNFDKDRFDEEIGAFLKTLNRSQMMIGGATAPAAPASPVGGVPGPQYAVPGQAQVPYGVPAGGQPVQYGAPGQFPQYGAPAGVGQVPYGAPVAGQPVYYGVPGQPPQYEMPGSPPGR
ncbi:hypothetical protein HDV00_004662 [Rhizophlyctis rosea]|nr:hypothetical protein HDV00_004662 [Rhizophlyctis rosea]